MNTMRGEVSVDLAGAPRRLCLTLGALAEIEGALGADGIGGLAERMRTLSARDLVVVLGALLRGGGEDPALAERAEPRVAAEGVARAFAASV